MRDMLVLPPDEELLCMPRYFFHLIDSIDVLLDPEGILMPADAVPVRPLYRRGTAWLAT